MAGGGAESTAGAGKVGTNGEDFGERGVGKEDGGYILCGSGVGRAFVWVRDVVSDPPDGEGPHGLPPPGGPTMAGMSPEHTGWDIGIPTHWVGDGDGGAR